MNQIENISFGQNERITDNNLFNASCFNLHVCLNLSNRFISTKREELLEWWKNIVRYS